MEVHAPSPADDRARPLVLVLTASVAFAMGLAGAWLGTSSSPAPSPAPERPEVGAHDSSAGGSLLDQTEPVGEDPGGEADVLVAEGPAVHPEPTEVGAERLEPEPSDPAPEAAASLEAAGLEVAGLEVAGLEATGLEATGLEATGLEAAGLEAADPEVHAAAPAPPEQAGDWVLERTGVAYLRCEGAPGARPGVCPRDEDFEAEVWSRIETLTRCATRPEAEGAGDLRLELRSGVEPEVRWRDTFHRSVVRLDEEAVLGCLSGPVSQVRSRPPGDRTLVSFRFRLVRR